MIKNQTIIFENLESRSTAASDGTEGKLFSDKEMKAIRKKPLPILIIALILWVGAFYATVKILASYNLNFRIWVYVIFWIFTVLLTVATLFIGIHKLGKYGCDNSAHIVLRITAWVGVLVLVAGLLFGGYICLLLPAFAYRPEHVVERDGKKMVASVLVFLDVSVYYYDYVNGFVRGNQWQINEWYGNIGKDPFEREVMPTPHRVSYNKG